MPEVRTAFLIKEGHGNKCQHKQQAQLPPPVTITCLFLNPYSTRLPKLSSTRCFHCHNCRLAPFKDQISVSLEGHVFKTGRRGTHPHSKPPTSFMTVDSTSPSAALRWGTTKTQWGKTLQEVRGVPGMNWSSGCLRTSITWEKPRAMKSSRAAGDFLSCQGDTASKWSVLLSRMRQTQLVPGGD